MLKVEGKDEKKGIAQCIGIRWSKTERAENKVKTEDKRVRMCERSSELPPKEKSARKECKSKVPEFVHSLVIEIVNNYLIWRIGES